MWLIDPGETRKMIVVAVTDVRVTDPSPAVAFRFVGFGDFVARSVSFSSTELPMA